MWAMQATWDIVRRYPSTLLVPLLLLGLLLGLGLWAVEELANQEEQCAKVSSHASSMDETMDDSEVNFLLQPADSHRPLPPTGHVDLC